MKATRKLIPALALLLISAVLLSTATYAWFTTNNTVTATMSVAVQAPVNLEISETGSSWGTTVALGDAGKLQPVSSINGINFVKCSNYTNSAPVYGVGDIDSKATFGKVDAGAKTGYVWEKTFYVRSEANDVNLDLSFAVTGPTSAMQAAVRIAVFEGASATGTPVAVLCPKTNNGGGTPDKTAYVEYDEGAHKYVAKSAAAVVNEYSFTLDKGAAGQQYCAVLWIEGNDANINQTAWTVESFNVTLSFALHSGT